MSLRPSGTANCSRLVKSGFFRLLDGQGRRIRAAAGHLACLKLAPRCGRTPAMFQQVLHYEQLMAILVTMALKPLAAWQAVGREITPLYPFGNPDEPNAC